MTSVVPAATVVLLRDHPDGLQTWLLRRVRAMAFAGGMSVFPGGRIDPSDGEVDVPIDGENAAHLAGRLGVTADEARASLVAAVRETFEETGVLLSVPPADLSARRADVESHVVRFGPLLADRELAVDAGAVRAWARWITPEPEPRRYDTHFYVAVLPADAVAAAGTSEASSAHWVGVRTALEQYERGERPMLPPTVRTLQEIAPFASAADVLAAAGSRRLDPISPSLSTGADGRALATLPDGSVFALHQ